MKAKPFAATGAIRDGIYTVDWTISPAVYAKGKCALHADGEDGMKSWPHYLAERENASYSSRERSYIMSPAKAHRIAQQLVAKETFQEIAQKIAGDICRKINEEAANCDVEHPYKAQGILEETIRILQAKV